MDNDKNDEGKGKHAVVAYCKHERNTIVLMGGTPFNKEQNCSGPCIHQEEGCCRNIRTVCPDLKLKEVKIEDEKIS